MLLPMELDTAMSPSPIRATMTLDSRSGTEVPGEYRKAHDYVWDPDRGPNGGGALDHEG